MTSIRILAMRARLSEDELIAIRDQRGSFLDVLAFVRNWTHSGRNLQREAFNDRTDGYTSREDVAAEVDARDDLDDLRRRLIARGLSAEEAAELDAACAADPGDDAQPGRNACAVHLPIKPGVAGAGWQALQDDCERWRRVSEGYYGTKVAGTIPSPFPCGHARTLSNSHKAGNGYQCAACANARWRARQVAVRRASRGSLSRFRTPGSH